VVTSSTVPTGTCTTGDTDILINNTMTSNGEVYTCTASAWVDSFSSIQGPQGPAGTNGTNGTSIVTSAGEPSGTCSNGDTDVDLANGEVYTCNSSAWSDTMSSIQGPPGVPGTGATVTSLASGNTNCPNGGAQITDGSGDTAYACNGANGSSSGPLSAIAYGTATLNVTAGQAFTLIPGLSVTITMPANPIVYVSADGGAYTTSEDGDGFSGIFVGLAVDGIPEVVDVPTNQEPLTMLNNAGVTENIGHWSLSEVFPLGTFAAGSTHTFQVGAQGGGIGATAVVSGLYDLDPALAGTISVLVMSS